MPRDIAASYNGSNATYRLLQAFNWGPMLMNLGYFRYRGPLAPLNWVTDMSKAQMYLARKSIELMDVRPGHRVLDIACGRGKSSYMTQQLHPGCQVTGIDLLPENVQVARTVYGTSPSLAYQQGNAMQLDFPDQGFDRILCLEAAFHFPDRAQFLRECRRVLRPGGRLVVVDIVWRTPEDRQTSDPELLKFVRDVWQWDDLYSEQDYREHGAAAGLRLGVLHDWTRKVTAPLLTLFGNAAWLASRAWGRRLLNWHNPLTQGMTDDDWEHIRQSALAHRQLRRHARYVAMVFSPDEPAAVASSASSAAVRS